MSVKSETSETKMEVEAATAHIECKLYKRRWLILAIFVLYSMSNSMQWIQFAIIADVVSNYYHNVDAHFINWTSMVYMITYIPLIFPASFFLDKKGLRMSAIVGAVGTCLGSWIKVGGIERDMFPVAFVGQTLVAMSQVFILSLPAQLAAVWFGPNEVSSACSIGVFGNQASKPSETHSREITRPASSSDCIPMPYKISLQQAISDVDAPKVTAIDDITDDEVFN